MFYIEVEDDGTGMFSTPKVVEMDPTVLSMLLTLRADTSEEGQEAYDELRDEVEEDMGVGLIHLMLYEHQDIAKDLNEKGMFWNADEQGYVAVSFSVEAAKKKIKREIIKESFDGEEW